jgi:tetratricopeptide (TPR) repeat protein
MGILEKIIAGLDVLTKSKWTMQLAKYGVIALCIFGVYASQNGFDQIWASESYQRRLEQTVLPVDTTSRISLGFDNVAADIHWLNAIQYLGVGTSQGGHPALPTMLENATTLDPDFEYPYVFSSLILPGEGHLAEAIKISEQGIKNVPTSWRIPYYAALSIYQIQLGDYDKASELVDLAATKPGAPESLSFIAAVLRSRTNEKVKAYYSWRVVVESAESEYSKERANIFIKHYETIFYLEKIARDYKDKFGKFPDRLEDLVSTRLISEVPQDPLGRGFIYQKESGEVFTNNSRRLGN